MILTNRREGVERSVRASRRQGIGGTANTSTSPNVQYAYDATATGGAFSKGSRPVSRLQRVPTC